MKRLLVFKFAEVEEEIKKNSGFMSFFADLLRVESIVMYNRNLVVIVLIWLVAFLMTRRGRHSPLLLFE